MAAGDIISATINSDGWTMDVVISGLGTGGSYAFGLGTNNNPLTGTPKVVLAVTSLQPVDGGTTTTITRTVYGVMAMRKAWPNDTTNEETFGGGNTTVRVILSDYVYVKDTTGAGNSGTAPTVTFLAGFYTYSGTPSNAAASVVATNSSTAPYQATISNWSRRGCQRVTGNFDLACVAFNRHGQQGRPVKSVKFTVADTHGHSVSTTVITPTIDDTFGDTKPVVEYVGTIDVSTLNALDVLTCNYVAYPWVGDTADVADTSSGAAYPSPLMGPITMLNDKSNTYGVTCALVDPTGSDAGANTVYDAASFNPATAYKFATIGKAASAIAAYNNTNRGRNTVGGGQIYLNAGSYAWLGSSNTYGTAPSDYITIQPADGVARSAVTIASASGNGDISDKIKLLNLTITVSTSNTFTNVNDIWLDQCDINTTGIGLFNTTGGIFSVTRSLIRKISQGLRPNSTVNCSPALVRGNDWTGLSNDILAYTVIGNGGKLASGFNLYDQISGQTGPASRPIVAYNEFLGCSSVGGEIILFGAFVANTVGAVFAQNVVENYNAVGTGMVSFGTSLLTHHNYIIWQNTFVGDRCFVGYNDTGSVAYYRRYWSIVNNYWDRFANKCDNFSPQDSNRVGGWPVKFSVGSSGDYKAENVFSLPGNFYAEFDGLSGYEPNSSAYGTDAEAQFVNRQSASSNGTGSPAHTANGSLGGGDYRIPSSSPLYGLPINLVLPYDLDGNVRSGNNSAGAYTITFSGSSGGMFFAS